ncbi:MAG: hypothetical protein AB8G05_22845 [Oligoflexales bacterium]
MKNFILLSLSLFAWASIGLSKNNLTLTENQTVKTPLFKLMKTLGYTGENNLSQLNAYAQKHLLRPADKERWNVYDDQLTKSHQEIIIKTLDEFGFFDEVTPELDQVYENVLILGASVGRMRSRVAFFNKLASQGLKYKKVYFLTGERPLDSRIESESILFEPGPNQIFRKNWQRPKVAPSNESGGARLAWDQLIGSKEKPIFVDVPMNKDKRPSTIDTINTWLDKSPAHGKTLVISNNPYIPYQHAVVLGALIKKGFITANDGPILTTVGSGTKPDKERLRVLLDNVARTLYNEKIIWEAKADRKLVQILVDKDYRGDENQVLGIRDALIALGTTKADFAVSPYEAFKMPIEKKAPDVFLISGSTGLSFLLQHSKQLPSKSSVIWSGHQTVKYLSTVAHKTSLIILPKHAVNKDNEMSLRSKTKLLLVEGVPHRVMKSSLKKAKKDYESKNGLLPEQKFKNLGIVLPGDAPNEKGEMLFFTPDDAKKLARNIVAVEGTNKHYLVTNGPRTGSHNYVSRKKLEPSPHRSKMLDTVTSAFMKELNKLGVKKTSIYDFQFSNLPSVYQPLLSLAADGMRIHIPGESTSMVTESTDVAGNVVIDIVPSMNQEHLSHSRAIKKREAAHILTWEGKFESFAKPHKEKTNRKTPAEIAAKEISKAFLLN